MNDWFIGKTGAVDEQLGICPGGLLTNILKALNLSMRQHANIARLLQFYRDALGSY